MAEPCAAPYEAVLGKLNHITGSSFFGRFVVHGWTVKAAGLEDNPKREISNLCWDL